MWISPAALCRMSPRLTDHIARGERLGAVAASAGVVLVVGCAAYGAAFGLWRAPLAAGYSALKLPCLVLAVALTTTLINAMLAALLRTGLTFRQTAICVLVGLATTGAVLGALSPIGAFIASSLPGPDPLALGLPEAAERAMVETRRAQGLLLFHVAAIAVAGVLGNVRLYGLLRRLVRRRDVALKVLLAWLALEFLVGAQLSWNLRPFLGRAHLPVTFFDEAPFSGSFYEEVATAVTHAIGVEGWCSLLVAAALLSLFAWRAARRDGLEVELSPQDSGLALEIPEARWTIPWTAVARVRTRRATGWLREGVELVLDVTQGPSGRLLANYEDPEEARARLADIERALRQLAHAGPFR